MLYLILRLITIILFKILFRLQAFGGENIPPKGRFILASNHTSYLDPPILGAACPRMLSFLAKQELFFIPVFAGLLNSINVFPLKTSSGDLRALRWAMQQLRQERALVIFPEGRRTPDGQLDEPMEGIGLLAAKTNATIIPAFIDGSNKALSIHSKLIRPVKIRVYFGKPIYPEKINRADKDILYKAIAEKTMEEIRRLKERIESSEKVQKYTELSDYSD